LLHLEKGETIESVIQKLANEITYLRSTHNDFVAQHAHDVENISHLRSALMDLIPEENKVYVLNNLRLIFRKLRKHI
jgi:ABC-type lipoprotein export system ATPase subunit